MALLPKSGAMRLKAWGLWLDAQGLQCAHLKGGRIGIGAPFLLQALTSYKCPHAQSRYMLEYPFLTMLPMSVFPRPFPLTHKKWNTVPVAVCSLVLCDTGLYAKFIIESKAAFSLLICFFALQTIVSVDIFIGVFGPVSRMEMLCVESLGLCSEGD